MEFTVDLTEEDLQAIKEHLNFRMGWIRAGMDEKERLDFAIAKVLRAADMEKKMKDLIDGRGDYDGDKKVKEEKCPKCTHSSVEGYCPRCSN
jgi:hypothetical protein